MKTAEQHHINQVCYRLEIELKDKQDELADAVEKLAPRGQSMRVRRGRGIWIVKSDGACRGNSCGYFYGIASTGRPFTFHYTSIITW